MTDHEGYVRGFCRNSKAWHAEACKDDLSVCFGMYDKDGRTSGEILMKWIELSNEQTPQLQSYCDSWSALALFTDLIQELSKVDSNAITEEEFVSILKRCNFQDLTPYKREDKTENKLKQELFQLEKRTNEIREALKTSNT